jgi:hypothetical protein
MKMAEDTVEDVKKMIAVMLFSPSPPLLRIPLRDIY